MRKELLPKVKKARIRKGRMATDDSYGNNGLFLFKIKKNILRVVASDELGWDHVSVSLSGRCPTWREMCIIKDLFFEPEETVIQFHPPESVYVNENPYTLHLWRNQIEIIELPPVYMV